jgi:DNA-binding LytR/AlgR family response regulator
MSSKELSIGKSYFFTRDGNRYHRIDFARIRYIEARKSYCRIDVGDKIRMAAIGIGELEEFLPREHFCRIHRSYIVGIAHIEWFENTVLRVADQELPVGDAYRAELPRRVMLVPGETPRIRVRGAGKSLAVL